MRSTAPPLRNSPATLHPVDLALTDLTREALAALISELGQPAFRARQIWHWLYERLETDPTAMTELPLALRAALGERLLPARLTLAEEHESADGSRKIVWACTDSARIETVWMPSHDGRLTLCLSSQVGCALACTFCATGTMGLKRNLSPGEYLEQVLSLHRRYGQRPDNLVLMGMGEPLHNRAALDQFLQVLSDPAGYHFSLRRVTLSTAGLMDDLLDFHRDFPQVNLAISLVSPFDAVRESLMPVNRRWPVAMIRDVIEQIDPGWGARVTLEYPLLAGLNDRPEDVRELVRVFGGQRVKVNLIPYNPTAHAPYSRPELERIEAMQRGLKAAGIPAFIRWSRGQDVAAACGQLVTTAA